MTATKVCSKAPAGWCRWPVSPCSASAAWSSRSCRSIELGAPLPANLAVDPLVAVLLGVALPHERVPISAPRIAVHGLCRAAVVAVRLANPDHEALPHPDEVSVAG